MQTIAVFVLVIVVILAMQQMRRRREAGEMTPLMRSGWVRKIGWPPAEQADTSELEREIDTLRRRVETLERALTERHGPDRLASEIEGLRDR